jgi:BirA family biotin operon repressor/biotin-[acetyl-CoA-carboxylase] ligase
MSVVLRDVDAIVPLAAAVAVAETVGEDARIKWPNDIWIDRRKVAGILLEGRPQEGWAVLGIGLNVRTREFPDELSEIATSLALAGIDVSAEDVLAELIPRLDRWIGAPADQVLAEWAGRDALRGERIGWAGGDGTAAGVDATGALLVELDGGETTALDAGEVHLKLSGR